MSLEHYRLIRDQIESDIRDAWGSNISVSFGLPAIEVEALPRAMVAVGTVQREQTGVHNITLKYTFEIQGVFALPATGGIDDPAMALAEDLILLLDPFTTDGSVPSTTNYAGISSVFGVSSYEVIDAMIEDEVFAVRIVFNVETDVNN